MASMNFQIPGRATAVTPSDTEDISPCYGFYVGGAGNVAVETEGGDSVTFTAPPVGTVIVLRIAKILSTGTTATNIVKFGGDESGDKSFITEVDGDFIVTATSGFRVVLPDF